MMLYNRIVERLSEPSTKDGKLLIETIRHLLITSTLITIFSFVTMVVIITK